jgi:hypothetical protein
MAGNDKNKRGAKVVPACQTQKESVSMLTKKQNESVKAKKSWKRDMDAMEELYYDDMAMKFYDPQERREGLEQRWKGYEVHIDEDGNYCCEFQDVDDVSS